jgi:hypothetical protein
MADAGDAERILDPSEPKGVWTACGAKDGLGRKMPMKDMLRVKNRNALSETP